MLIKVRSHINAGHTPSQSAGVCLVLTCWRNSVFCLFTMAKKFTKFYLEAEYLAIFSEKRTVIFTVLVGSPKKVRNIVLIYSKLF